MSKLKKRVACQKCNTNTYDRHYLSDTGFDIVSPAELKAYRTRDPDWGVDLVIDCSGYVPAMEEAVTYLNPGGKLCMFGVSSPDAKMR